MPTIVMYHYVRDLPNSRFPRIKGLLTEEFDQQLDYITARYTVCSLQQVADAIRGEDVLPANACVLTFDDGFIDHYVTVMPRLVRRGIVGSFFVPAQPVLEHSVLGVHKIHFILAAVADPIQLGVRLRALVAASRAEHELPSDEGLWASYGRAGRYDSTQVMFIKAMLQHALPDALRTSLVDELFAEYVSDDEAGFAGELYLDESQIRAMADAGMEFGGHGYAHLRWDRIPTDLLQREVDLSLDFLARCLGARPASWSVCYPFGAYDATTLKLLQKAGCIIGLTTRPQIVADLQRPLELGRLNTNDLPPRSRG